MLLYECYAHEDRALGEEYNHTSRDSLQWNTLLAIKIFCQIR